jgi:hypothetical protein
MELFTIGTTDPFGKETVGLTRDERVSGAKAWRKKKIDEAERKGIKELLVKAGEFGHGMRETVKYALDKGFSVKVVSGGTYCDSRNEIINFLKEYPKSFKYYVVDGRPDDHFAIIGRSNLFIEVPHAWDAKIKRSLGITDAHYHILNRFNETFENTIKMAKNIDTAKQDDINYLNGLPCLIPKNN